MDFTREEAEEIIAGLCSRWHEGERENVDLPASIITKLEMVFPGIIRETYCGYFLDYAAEKKIES